MRRTRPRRGITLIETSVSCFLGVLLVYLVARSGSAFTHGAATLMNRAELVREGDLAAGYLEQALRSCTVLNFTPCGECAKCQAQDPRCPYGELRVEYLRPGPVSAVSVFEVYRGWLTRRDEQVPLTEADEEGATKLAHHAKGLTQVPRAPGVVADVRDIRLDLQIPDREDVASTMHFVVVMPTP
jgi:hypothetical protein